LHTISFTVFFVGQDCILRTGFQPVLSGFFTPTDERVKNPLQVTNLPHNYFTNALSDASTSASLAGREKNFDDSRMNPFGPIGTTTPAVEP
jgi:hypothetical protein